MRFSHNNILHKIQIPVITSAPKPVFSMAALYDAIIDPYPIRLSVDIPFWDTGICILPSFYCPENHLTLLSFDKHSKTWGENNPLKYSTNHLIETGTEQC